MSDGFGGLHVYDEPNITNKAVVESLTNLSISADKWDFARNARERGEARVEQVEWMQANTLSDKNAISISRRK